jgi:hypothetical protein
MIGHCTGVLRWTTAAILGVMLTALPLSARAGEPEGIRLTLDAPPECLAERDLAAQVDALGAHWRLARSDERARAFEVTIAPERDSYTARLIVRDLVGETTERTVMSPRCSDAAKSVALLVALALDEAEIAHADPAREERLASPGQPFWPAPAEDDAPTGGVRVIRGRAGRQGSGGLVLTGIYGRSLYGGSMDVAGARTYAAARVSGSTRIGASLAFASETERSVVAGNTLYESSGWTGRAGAIVGWGAPWNDTVIGFLGEGGVALGQQSGRASRDLASVGRECSTAGTSSIASIEGRCFDTGHSAPSSVRSLSPFAAMSLVLQIPWKAPVRPVAGFTTTAVFGGERVAVMSVTGDLGFVWQAW